MKIEQAKDQAAREYYFKDWQYMIAVCGYSESAANRALEIYGQAQRIEWIKEGFEAARANMTTTGWRHDPDGYGKQWAITEVLYPTVEDYLNTKK